MRILLYGINFHPELTGIGKYSGEMAAWLASQGHHVDVITAPPYYPQWRVGPGYSAWRFRRHELHGSEGRVQVLRCPLWVPGRVSGLTRVLHLASFALSSSVGLLWGLSRRPDVALVVIPTLLQTPQAWALGRIAGVPLWLHVQDFEVDAALDMGLVGRGGGNQSLLRRFATGVEAFFLRRFDRVSSISSAMVQRLHDKGVAPHRTVEFPNWVDLQAIHPIPRSESMRQELGLPDDKVVVLYSGNMGEKQGLDLVVEAASRLRADARLHFVLAGAGSARKRLERAAEGFENVTWLPLQPLEKLNALLATADIHVLPQRADAADLVMPSKLTGMLASGRAVVGTAGATTQLGKVLDTCGWRVAPESPTELVQALEALAGDPERRQALGAAGRRLAEQTLDQDVIMRAFVAQADELLAWHQAGRGEAHG